MPLPPYIEHGDSADDERRYQTVFARPGAVAAPTAALHFDETLLAELEARGVQRANVTLHVGAGTFQPVKVETIADHVMHSERYVVPEATQRDCQCRARGGRVVAVGNHHRAHARILAESGAPAARRRSSSRPASGWFKLVDLFVTNFHLPKSTLMMLVSAFAGYETVMALYARHPPRLPFLQLWRRHAARPKGYRCSSLICSRPTPTATPAAAP